MPRRAGPALGIALSEITPLLERAHAGDEDAWRQVVALLHDDLLRLLRSAGGPPDSTQAAALAQACYEHIAGNRGESGIGNRSHFLALAGRAVRQVLVEQARAQLGTAANAAPQDGTPATPQDGNRKAAGELLSLDALLEQLSREDERLVRVVDSRIFGGLTDVETAEALRLPLRTVQKIWARAREQLQNLRAA
jgi:RNA polymerase sigma factor (TIGR02999 family)